MVARRSPFSFSSPLLVFNFACNVPHVGGIQGTDIFPIHCHYIPCRLVHEGEEVMIASFRSLHSAQKNQGSLPLHMHTTARSSEATPLSSWQVPKRQNILTQSRTTSKNNVIALILYNTAFMVKYISDRCACAT